MRTPLLATLAVFVCVTPLAARQSDAPVRLSGRVLEEGTDAPVALAEVRLEALRTTVLTDNEGRFTMPRLRPGVHRFAISRLGYITHIEEISVEEDTQWSVRLSPRPLELERVSATVDRLDQRLKAVPYATRVYAEADLAFSASPSMAHYITAREGLAPIPCPGGARETEPCVRVRGRSRPLNVYVDDVKMPGSWGFLDHYQPHEIYRVEVFPSLAMVRLYTPRYMDWVVRGRTPLRPCILC